MYIRVITFLLSIIIIQSCGSNGWIIASIPVTPQDTVTTTVFKEIMDADSTDHWFHGNISDYSNWCYRHQRLEEVRVQ